MSKLGRFQDAVWEILVGYDHGYGSHHDGPLAHLPVAEQARITRDIEDAASRIFCDEGMERRWP